VAGLLRFPNPVNEVAARTVAAGVVVMSVAFVASRATWILVVLAYGFVARVLTGPRLSPLGQFATRVVAPALAHRTRLVPGPPKRFAQGIGTTLSVSALVAVGLGGVGVAQVLVAMIGAAAFAESAFAFCLGCTIFAGLMRAGIVPASVCEACNDLSSRLAVR